MIQFMFFITFSFSFWLNNTSHFYSFTADFFGGGGRKIPAPTSGAPWRNDTAKKCQITISNNNAILQGELIKLQ